MIKQHKSLFTLHIAIISGYDDGLVNWRPCRFGSSNHTVDKIFYNVYLFRVPGLASMSFIRGNRCIERER